MKVRWVKVGDVMSMDRTPVTLEAGEYYRRIGIYSWGRGMIHHPAASAAEMGSLRYFRFPPDALVLSNIQAWEQAVAISTDDEAERYVCSNRFLPYVSNRNEVDLRYVLHFLLSERGHELLKRASPGTQVRNRTLGKRLFGESTIPLPPIEDQRRIAAHLDSMTLRATQTPRDALTSLDKLRFSGEPVRVRELVSQVSRPVATIDDVLYRMQGVRWYGGGMFEREIKAGSELAAKTVYRVEDGDLIYNRLFAWKQSFALAGPNADGFVSSEFPTFQVNHELVEPTVLLHLLLSEAFTVQVNEASAGSTPTSRNRLKVSRFLDLEVPLPNRSDQSRIRSIIFRVHRAKALAARAASFESALLPSARNEIFSAMR